MIEIICDKCERSFTVEDEKAGGKVECPLCGDVNRVPESAAGAAGTARPAAPGPGHDSSRGAESEREICIVRPAMFRAHPLRGLLIGLLIVGGVVGAMVAWRQQMAWLAYLSLVPSVFGAGWLIKWWIGAYLWIRITISNKRTVRHEGIIRRHSTEVLHDHVRSVDIRQNFVQRLFNTGYIGIDSAGQDDIEIEIRDIPGPYRIKKIIDQYRTM